MQARGFQEEKGLPGWDGGSVLPVVLTTPSPPTSGTDGAGLCPAITAGDSRGPGSRSVPGAEPGGPTFLSSTLFFLFPLKETHSPHY